MEDRDDYPIIPQPEKKTGEEKKWDDYKQIQKELASLKEENAKLKGLLKESYKAFEYGELELRTTYQRFTGYKGSSSLWLMQDMIEKTKGFSDNK